MIFRWTCPAPTGNERPTQFGLLEVSIEQQTDPEVHTTFKAERVYSLDRVSADVSFAFGPMQRLWITSRRRQEEPPIYAIDVDVSHMEGAHNFLYG